MKNPRHALIEATVLFGCLLGAWILVVGFTEYRSAQSALPGDRLVVFFPDEAPAPEVLRSIGSAGAVMTEPLPFANAYRVFVLESGAPATLARDAWVFRDPVAALAECFGFAPPRDRQQAVQ